MPFSCLWLCVCVCLFVFALLCDSHLRLVFLFLQFAPFIVHAAKAHPTGGLQRRESAHQQREIFFREVDCG
jgi:hypothetical protein